MLLTSYFCHCRHYRAVSFQSRRCTSALPSRRCAHGGIRGIDDDGWRTGCTVRANDDKLHPIHWRITASSAAGAGPRKSWWRSQCTVTSSRDVRSTVFSVSSLTHDASSLFKLFYVSFIYLLDIQSRPKKWTPNSLHMTSSDIGLFSKFFHCYNL